MPRIVALTFVGFALTTLPARADLIIGNLGSNTGFTVTVGPNSPPTASGSTASAGFTMGATAYSLTSASLSIQGADPAAKPLLRLTSDLAGTNTLLTFTTPSLGAGAYNGNFTFTPPSAFTLQANTIYYLTLGALGTTLWNANNTGTQPTGTAATAAAQRGTGLSTDFVLKFQVEGTRVAAVPEPGAIGMLAAGLPCVGLVTAWGRRRIGLSA